METLTANETLICARCKQPIEVGTQYREVDGVPYHEECFSEMYCDWKGVKKEATNENN